MNVDALIAKWTSTYVDQGQGVKDISHQLFAKEKTDGFFSTVMETNDVYRHMYSTSDDVLQPFTAYFNSKGGMNLDPQEQKLGTFKINKDLKPDDVKNSYAAFLADQKEMDRAKWSLIRYEITQSYIPKSKDNYERDVAYRGWQVTGFGADATNTTTLARTFASQDAVLPANASMDGIWIQIVRGVAASKVNVISTGAWSTTPETFVGQIEAFMMDIPAEARGEIDYLFMSEDLYNRYLDGVDAKYNMNYAQHQDKTKIKKTNARVEWIRGMDDAQKVWCTRASNRVRPTHVENTGKFDVGKKDIYTIQVATDWKKQITFKAMQLVWTNDLENTITAGNVTSYYS